MLGSHTKRKVYVANTRLEAIASAEYWIHFMMRFDGVHAFSYTSAGSESIWMKFGGL